MVLLVCVSEALDNFRPGSLQIPKITSPRDISGVVRRVIIDDKGVK